MADELTALYGRLYLDQDIPVQLALTRDRLLDLLNRFDREQLCNNLFYA
jgi:hypothetical protein